jgi:hypothetical protein
VTVASGDVIAERWMQQGKQGEGKRTLYDTMAPHFFNEIGEETGSQVEDISFPSTDQSEHSEKGLRLTEEMRRRLLSKSIPDFARGGLVDMEDEDYYREHMYDPGFDSREGTPGSGSQDDDDGSTQALEPRTAWNRLGYDPLSHVVAPEPVAPEPVAPEPIVKGPFSPDGWLRNTFAGVGRGIASLGRGARDKVREYANIPNLLGAAASFATGHPLIGLGIRGIGKGIAQRLEDRKYYPGGRELHEDYWRDVDSPREKIIDFRPPGWPEDDQQEEYFRPWWMTTINPLTGRYYESDPQLSQGIPREEPNPKRTAYDQWENISDKASSEAQRLKDIWYGPRRWTDADLDKRFFNQGGLVDKPLPAENLDSYPKSSTWIGNEGIAAYLPGGVLPVFMEGVLRAKSGRSRSETTTPLGIGGQWKVLQGMFGKDAPSARVGWNAPNSLSAGINIPVRGGNIDIHGERRPNEGYFGVRGRFDF